MKCSDAYWRLHGPAIEVLNSLRVTIPPELRELLLDFIICYLIDRPTDSHSYAAAHFQYHLKLRDSYMVRYPHRETIKTSVTDQAVRTLSTAEGKEERNKKSVSSTKSLGAKEARDKKSVSSTNSLGATESKTKKHESKKAVTPEGKEEGDENAVLSTMTVDKVESEMKKPEIKKSVKIQVDDAASSVEEPDAMKSVQYILKEAVDFVFDRSQDSDDKHSSKREGASVAQLKPSAMAAVEQTTPSKNGDDAVEQATQETEHSQVLEAFAGVVEQAAEPDQGGEREESARVSAATIAAYSVVDVLHSTYQSLEGVSNGSKTQAT